MTYYDDRAQVVQHRASTHLGGVEKEWFKLDFLGRAVSHKITHKPSTGSALSEVITQTYDTWDRPLVTKHKRGSSTAVTIASRTYDKAGRLKTLTRNGKTALKSTYSYNIRSWLYDISGTLFSETLSFVSGSPARYGGDVTKMTWKDDRNTGTTRDSYSFTYNGVGRLLQANYTDHDSASGANFTEKVGYDRNGNITTLQRYGRTGASTYGRIDYLTLSYSGNRLSTVKDTGSAAYSTDFRFSNTTSTTYSYTYDAAGRMKKDAAKGISSITWNVLGLPQTVTFSNGNVINYSYAADGTKLRESKTASGTTTTTDYTGTLVLEDGTRSRMLFDGGYISMSDNAYHFFLTDHLGSVRVVASASGVAEEYNHYYPLGGLLPTSATGTQPLKYQGKEWAGAKGLNLYDFGARRYDPATGRWLSPDPLAEKYYGHSPYLFCAANPMRFVDPEGTYFTPKSIPYVQLIVGYSFQQIGSLSDLSRRFLSIMSAKTSLIETIQMRLTQNLLQSAINDYWSAIGELVTMAASDQGYNTIMSNVYNNGMTPDYIRGGSYFNMDTGLFDLVVPSDGVPGLLAHELKHGYQFDIGALSSGHARTGKPFYDINDELEAYQRGALFGADMMNLDELSSDPQYYLLQNRSASADQYPLIPSNRWQEISNQYQSVFRVNGSTYVPTN